LSKLVDKPTVLIFASYTCPFFLQHGSEIQQLADKYRGRANVFVVYTAEAHPSPNPPYGSSRNRGIFVIAKTLDERANAARAAVQELHLALPILLDSMDDRGVKAYGSVATIRMYVLDRNRRVVHKS